MFQFMFMVQLLVKFSFFIQELWERKSLQILYECWRRAYHALLVQLFILVSCLKGQVKKNVNVEACEMGEEKLYMNESLNDPLQSFLCQLELQDGGHNSTKFNISS